MPLLVNDERISLTAGQPVDKTYSWEMEGEETVELRLTELDEVDPAGRYRLRVTDDEFKFERATAAKWAEFETFITISKDGTILNLSEDNLGGLFGLLLMEVDELLTIITLLTG